MRRLGLICLLMCFWYCADAQIQTISREKLESVNTPLLSSDAKALKFELTRINAETMNEEDGVQTFVYPFENIGKDTILIKRIVSTCSCATALCEKKTVAPGDKSEIVVRYNPKGHPGRFERKVFVYTDDMQSPSAILRLSVEVERGKGYEGLYPISMGAIRVRRNEILVKRGVQAVEKCVFVNVSDGPLRLLCEKAMLPSCLTFKVEPEVVNAGKEGEIIITYDPAKGGVRDRMPVILKGLGVPPSQSTINVIIKEK
jgi:hypothetical protein